MLSLRRVFNNKILRLFLNIKTKYKFWGLLRLNFMDDT
jgi:hypothetical protein